MNASACVCARAREFNLMSSALRTMRGNKVNGERKQAVIVLTLFWDLVSVWRGEKRDTCEEPHMQKSEERRKKERSGFPAQRARPLPPFHLPTPFLYYYFLFILTNHKAKKSELDWRHIRLPASTLLLMRPSQGRSSED